MVDTNKTEWLLRDANFLLQNQRKFSAMLLLLCIVDSLAKQRYPDCSKVGDRCEKFLTDEMRRPGRPQIHNIYVPEEGLLSFEKIIYKYLRNSLVHEGVELTCDTKSTYKVQIDWDELPNGLKVDSDHHRVILGGNLIINILLDAINNALSQE